MGGINGFLFLTRRTEDHEQQTAENQRCVQRMNSLVEHRGPHKVSIFTCAAAGLSAFAAREDDALNNSFFYDQREKLVAVFDGEIYNATELAQELDGDCCSRSLGSAELVLRLFKKHGDLFPCAIEGPFAAAIYSVVRNDLCIARDRCGQKPLYYYHDGDKVVFASELKSIIHAFPIKKEINPEALSQYLALTCIPAPLTIYKSVSKVEPGMFVRFANGEAKKLSFWDVDGKSPQIADYRECKRLLRQALSRSVEMRLQGLNNAGIFLSGGIDSTIVAGLMAQFMPGRITAHTISFGMKGFDESAKAKLVAEQHKLRHLVHQVTCADFTDQIERIFQMFDEPFGDASSIPTYFAARNAVQHNDTVLTGDGSDQIFAGSGRYLIEYYSAIYAKIPAFARRHLIEAVLYRCPDRYRLARRLRKVAENISREPFERRKAMIMSGFKPGEVDGLLNADWLVEESDAFIRDIYSRHADFDDLAKTLYVDFRIAVEGQLLPKVEKAMQVNCLNARMPMLDTEVVQLAFQIPSNFKLKGKRCKYILIDTFSDLIPRENLNQKKEGFCTPIGEWFRGPLKETLLDLLSEKRIREQGIFQYGAIQRLLGDHMQKKGNHQTRLWQLFVFQKWYDSHWKGL